MNATEREEAYAILHDLFWGAQIVGVRWIAYAFTVLFVRFEPVPDEIPPDRRYHELWLTIETRWAVFPKRPERLPESEADLPEPPLEARVSALVDVNDHKIVQVELGEPYPHLILTFDSGQVFFLNSYHNDFECWNLNTITLARTTGWLIVALQGGDMAIYRPPKASPSS